MEYNKFGKILLIIVLMTLGQQNGFSQGTFENLDFENPVQPLDPVNGQVTIGDGLPGWTGYAGSTPVGSGSQIWYNTVSLSGSALSLQGPGSPFPVPQGNYSAGIQGSTSGQPESISLGQTGQIPPSTQALLFDGADLANFQVSFAGQMLPYVAVGTGPNYTIYGANISEYAGQTGQLLFTALPDGEAFIDDIQFSPTAIPEPQTWTLLLCGAGALAVWRRKQIQ